MINDLVQLFKKAYEKNGDKIILDRYRPKNGLYIRINKDGRFDKTAIGKDVQEDDLYKWFRDRDYYSILLAMNKSVDPKKKIHSNNYLTLFMKKNIFPAVGEEAITRSEFTERVIEYYQILEAPEKKYSDKKTKELMENINIHTDKEVIERNKNYILENLDEIIEIIKSENFDGYVSLFFDEDLAVYERECKKYMVPKIFNKNDFNIAVGDKIWGLSNYNMGSNSKKPYLELKTTKFKVPYRTTVEDAVLTKKFFDWLNYQPERELLIPEDYDFERQIESAKNNKHGNACYYIYVSKGQEVTIEDFEYLPRYNKEIDFKVLNVLQLGKWENDKLHLIDDEYFTNRDELELYTNLQFFNKRLISSYFQEPKIKAGEFSKIMQNLLMVSRKAFHSFFRKAVEEDLKSFIEDIGMEIIKEQIRYGGNRTKAAFSYNLWAGFLDYYSIKGGEQMADRIKGLLDSISTKITSGEIISCESDDEFYFTAGQLAYFILDKSEADKKSFDMAEPFLRARSDVEIKKQLKYALDRYTHAIDMHNIKFKNALSMVLGYKAEGNYKDYEDIFIAGLLAKNIFYEKREKKSDNKKEGEKI